MIKCIAAILIIVGCGGVGICMRMRLYDTIKQTEDIVNVLHMMSNEMIYHKSALEEICVTVADKAAIPINCILRGIVIECNENSAKEFGTVWKDKFEHPEEKLILTLEVQKIVEDIFLVKQLSPDLQYEGLQENIEKIEEQLKIMKEDSKNKGRLYICIGVMTGLISTILLI